ncbi:SDR family oxidoreductase [Marinobacter sp. R17]|uniref:SDR family oxidoreductase n=1 Tax=Marinobacter sp. R17 TaxID=2484250 RepID=UPI000F4D25CA|nr:SDR family oxidoreductase [Marinobacter sp. R17]ROU00692.1 SDR family oxidoreductase [Marinobacter sp. R17]
MRVLVTGATGFVGSAVVEDLLKAGHRVLGLARSDASAARLAESGADVHRGDIEDLDSLRLGAESCDGVIHTAFNHDFSKFAENCENDRKAVEVMGEVLIKTGRPLVVTSGIGLLAADRLVTESDQAGEHSPRKATEEATGAVMARGANVSVVRLPPSVHGKGDHGFVPILINLARENGYAAYIDDGENCWPAVSRLDAATLFRLALERAQPGAVYHAVAEQGVPFKEIAEAIGAGLGLPVKRLPRGEAAGYFDWFTHFAAIDCRASSTQTREQLAWQPRGPDLIADMAGAGYFEVN